MTKEEERAKKAAYYQAHKDVIKSRSAKWAKENRALHNANGQEWKKKNKDKVKRSAARYYVENKEKIQARERWEKLHPEEARAKKRAWYAENAEKERKRAADWKRRNPDNSRIHSQNRRVRKGEGKLSRDLAAKLRILQQNKCAACKNVLTKYHLDHVVPLAAGGIHEDSNMQLLCPFCNHSKKDRDPIKFMQSRGFLL
jgi:hypothetical protein